jgi:hypothetical protein
VEAGAKLYGQSRQNIAKFHILKKYELNFFNTVLGIGFSLTIGEFFDAFCYY